MKIREEMTGAAAMEYSPFTEEFIPENFHSEVARLNLLKSIRQDLVEGLPLVVVAGEAGSGKSVIGRMLACEKIDGCNLVYFGKTVISFEEVIATLGRIVEVEITDLSRQGVAAAVEKIAERAENLPERLTLIFDGAERVYLATLERIRKMLDRLNAHKVQMQVLFIGRPALLENLKQLEICNLKQQSENRYSLKQLSRADATVYLEMCTGRLPRGEAELFSAEVVEHICKISKGNYRRLNRCAEEVRRKRDPDASFFVLLDRVEGNETGDSGSKSGQKALAWGFKNTTRVLTGGALVATLAAGLWLTNGNSGNDEPIPPVAPAAAVIPVVEQPLKAGDLAVLTGSPRAGDEGIGVGELRLKPLSHPEAALAEPAAGSEGNVAETIEEKVASLPQQQPEVASQTIMPEAESKVDPNAADDAEALVPETELMAEGAEQIDGPAKIVADQTVVNSAVEPDVDTTTAANVDTVGTEVVRIEPKSLPRKNLAAEQLDLSPHSLKDEPAKRIVVASNPAEAIQAESADITVEGESSPSLEVESPAQGLSDEEVDLIFGKPLEGEVVEAATLEPESDTDHLSLEAPGALAEQGVLNQDPDQEVQAELEAISAEPKKVVKPVEATVSSIKIKKPSVEAGALAAAANTQKVTVGEGVPVAPSVTEDDQQSQIPPAGIYPSRLAAGESWLQGESDHKYTMQIMVLSAEESRTTIEQMFDSQSSRDDAENLFIFEGREDAGQVYVFYGEYDTLEDARSARDGIPDALKEHNPYVLSVPVAVERLL